MAKKAKKLSDKVDTQISKKAIFLLVIFSLVFSIAVLEILLRFMPSKITKIDFSTQRDNRIFTTARGFEYKPNSMRAWVGLGPPTIWYFNNYGFRDRSFPQNQIDSKLYKIAFIGDSIVMGLGVEEYEALPHQLEAVLQPNNFTGGNTQFYRVYNLGIWASGPEQYDGVMKEIGTKLKPDLVIVSHFVNDTSDDFGFEKDKKYNLLKSIPDTLVPFTLNEFLKGHSYLYLFLLTKYYTFVERFHYTGDITKQDLITGWKFNSKAINEIKTVSEKNGAKFLLIGVPHINQILNFSKTDRMENIQKYIVGNTDMDYLDLEPFLRAYPNLRELYIDGEDTHFSVKGNQVIANYLADYLRKNNLVPAK